jgi:hypothetical protein
LHANEFTNELYALQHFKDSLGQAKLNFKPTNGLKSSYLHV